MSAAERQRRYREKLKDIKSRKISGTKEKELRKNTASI